MTRVPRIVLFLFAGLMSGSVAAAQDAATAGEPPPSGSIVIMAPGQSTPEQNWLTQDLEDAERRSKRSRNALIGTSAAFVVGLVLAGAGASQCEVITRVNRDDELICNNAGDVLLPLGGTIAGLSAIGMITSGIILGVANKRKREAERRLRRYDVGRRLQWDTSRGAVTF